MTLNLQKDFKIITKILFKNKEYLQDKESVARFFDSSLKNLKQDKVYALLLHDYNDIYHVWEQVQNLKQLGLCEKIGVSVYNPSDLLKVLDMFDIDICQIPLNILDQRFISLLPELKKRNIEIHVRSVFLQGILLAPRNFLEGYFKKPLERYISFLNKTGLSPLEACLNFVSAFKEIDFFVVGVLSKEELLSNIMCFKEIIPLGDMTFLATEDENVIIPALWKK